MVQHYTSNPLQAFTGKIEKPLISIQYLLRTDKEHISECASLPLSLFDQRSLCITNYFFPSVIVRAQHLLVLSDVEFMNTVVNYLKAIFDPKVNQASPSSESIEETVKGAPELSETSSLEVTLTASSVLQEEQEKPVSKLSLPRIKCQVSVTNFRVAIIEDVYTENPQALTLRVSIAIIYK